MLFNSYPFLFVFLPLTLLGYQIAARYHRKAVVAWLALASCAFYAYWHPPFLILLLCSILFNYLCASLISRRIPNRLPSSAVLWFAIAANLSALCYYKYFFPLLNFFSWSLHSPTHWNNVLLPLGISFFTFTQIAFLVDLQQGAAEQQGFWSYLLFVTFFPHLIAGPIIHHAEIMPQFQQQRDYRLRADDLAVGFSWFVMGLFKKVIFADRFAKAADAAFAHPGSLGAFSAWGGVLSYALQLYFDFSGYSDMALGLARMFSIDFPLNFSSPYKATNIIDFWQRWHMTLTRYITAYIYNPTSMWISRRRLQQGKKVSRKAAATPSGFTSMVAVPTIFTLLLAGIWHGAGLQFVIFGLLHGIYLTVNHAWRIFRGKAADVAVSRWTAATRHVSSLLLTFLAVLVGQVFFRAGSVSDACAMLAGMVGLHSLHPIVAEESFHISALGVLKLAFGFVIVWAFPNTQQILEKFKPSLALTRADITEGWIRFFWHPNAAWALTMGAAFFIALVRMQDPTTFLYFQF